VIFEPLDFLSGLAALVSNPGVNSRAIDGYAETALRGQPRRSDIHEFPV
jgi:hypothetical protein